MLVNVYAINKELPMGFGDFIRGCVTCHQLSLKNKFDFDFDLKKFSKFYKSEEVLLKKSIYTEALPKAININLLEKNLNSLLRFKRQSNLNDTDLFVLTNAWPKGTAEKHEKIEDRLKQKTWGKISKETKDFIKSRLIPIDFQSEFIKNLPKKYEVVHIRAGDNISFINVINKKSLDIHNKLIEVNSFDELIKAAVSRISKILKKTKHPLIILSDSDKVKDDMGIAYAELITKGKIFISEVNAKHSGVDGLQETFHDLTILNNAKEIHQLSVYNWGSGFSNIAHHIYDVPIKRYPKLK